MYYMYYMEKKCVKCIIRIICIICTYIIICWSLAVPKLSSRHEVVKPCVQSYVVVVCIYPMQNTTRYPHEASNHKVVLSNWMYLDDHSFGLLFKALTITYLVTSILPAPSSCVWRNAKCLRFPPTSCPGQQQGYAQLKHECRRIPWFSLLSGASWYIFMLKQQLALPLAKCLPPWLSCNYLPASPGPTQHLS